MVSLETSICCLRFTPTAPAFVVLTVSQPADMKSAMDTPVTIRIFFIGFPMMRNLYGTCALCKVDSAATVLGLPGIVRDFGRIREITDFRAALVAAAPVHAASCFGGELRVHDANALELDFLQLLEIHEHVVGA